MVASQWSTVTASGGLEDIRLHVIPWALTIGTADRSLSFVRNAEVEATAINNGGGNRPPISIDRASADRRSQPRASQSPSIFIRRLAASVPLWENISLIR